MLQQVVMQSERNRRAVPGFLAIEKVITQMEFDFDAKQSAAGERDEEFATLGAGAA
jgi:hypothetical protein